MPNNIKTFPLKIEEEFNKEIDKAVFLLNQNLSEKKITKHQFILEAIAEKKEKVIQEYNEKRSVNWI